VLDGPGKHGVSFHDAGGLDGLCGGCVS